MKKPMRRNRANTEPKRSGFGAFSVAPAGSVLAIAAENFNMRGGRSRDRNVQIEDRGPLPTDPAVLRPIILRGLKNCGMREELLGEKWFDAMVDVVVSAVAQQSAATRAAAASQPPPKDQPDFVLGCYGWATFLATWRHYRALGRPIEETLYATATELGPGISLADMDRLVRWWVGVLDRCTPEDRRTLEAAVKTIGASSTSNAPYNMALNDDEFFAIAGVLDQVRLFDLP